MDETFIRNRITELRTKKNVSEYKMSLDLGHGKNYIRDISSGRTLPSITEFLYICEYLGVSEKDFFDIDEKNPALIQKILERARLLNEDDLLATLGVMERMNQ